MEKKDEDADPPISSPKIVVKIKLNKMPAAAAAETVEDEKKHYCKECNKSFASGKALGGHVSSFHVQANKDYSHKRLASKISKFPGTAAAEITCNICSRGFRSEKSLYGHMRCHPDRCYRGMEPPSPVTSSEDSSGGQSWFDLKNWPKERRGRGPLIREDPVKIGESSSSRLVVGGKNKEKVDEDEDEEELFRTAVEVLMMGKLGKKHVCVLCDKAFDTHQALGGHRSSHSKLKLVIVNEDKDVGKAKKRRVNGDVRSEEEPVIGFDLNLMPDEDEDEDEDEKGK